MDIDNKKIGEALILKGMITQSQLDEALEEQKVSGQQIDEIVVNKNWVSQKEIDKILAETRGLALFDLSRYIIPSEVVELVPEEFARTYDVIPIFKVAETLTVAMADPNNVFVIDELQRIVSCPIEPVLANKMDISKSQDQYYGSAGTIQEIVAALGEGKNLSDGEKIGEDAPTVRIVNIIISDAVERSASDIHVEPEENVLNIRYRIDGILHRHIFLPKFLQSAIISRFKIMADLDIAERRVPQDGRIMMKVGTKDIDFRVSTCPTVHGENIVLRILDKSSMTCGLENLGFPKRELKILQEMIVQPYGVILVTGPTGSGKTTTLYAALQKINKEDINIMTVEDPVEYQVANIRQVQVNSKAGLTFASALRAFLRQDPDVVMVGEIRDLETAEIAIQAALTGHLVLSTLHTNDTASAFTRIIEMEVEPFLVSSSVLGILAQRLARKVCSKCKEEYIPSSELLISLGLEELVGKTTKFVRGRGCKLCNKSGYRGRVGIYEVLKISPPIQKLVLKKSSAEEIRKIAKMEGMKTLREGAIQKLLAGIITPEEVFRVTKSSEA